MITPKEELRVWYAKYYGNQLGKKTFKQMQESENQGNYGDLFGLCVFRHLLQSLFDYYSRCRPPF